MEESYVEELATHDVPESCAGIRKDAGEALTGVRTGRVLSREIRSPKVPTLLSEAEGHVAAADIARQMRTTRGRRPLACAEPFCARTGRPT